MPNRGLCYYSVVVPRYFVRGFPGIALTAGGCWTVPSTSIDTIRIIDHDPSTRAAFTQWVEEGLALVRRCDAIRYKRVRAYVRTILSNPRVRGCYYLWPLKYCAVNVPWFHTQGGPERESPMQLFASFLVRDATYGYLFARGVPLTRRNRPRFDYACCLEAQRFIRRAGPSVNPWDPFVAELKASKEIRRRRIQAIEKPIN